MLLQSVLKSKGHAFVTCLLHENHPFPFFFTLFFLSKIHFYNPCVRAMVHFFIVRANFEKYDLCSAPIARALPRYIVPFFKFFKTGKCFKTMLFPVSCVSQKPLVFEKQPKTHAKTMSERSEKCATLQVLMGTDSVGRAKYLQRALSTLRCALYQV